MKVLCNAERCIHWKELKEPVITPRAGIGEAWDWDKCSGECLRDEIVIKFQNEVPGCWFYSSRDWPTGHMDWSRFPQGGAI